MSMRHGTVAKAYYLRLIMYNHSDAFCIKILKEVVVAMRADSVVLISDRGLPCHHVRHNYA